MELYLLKKMLSLRIVRIEDLQWLRSQFYFSFSLGKYSKSKRILYLVA